VGALLSATHLADWEFRPMSEHQLSNCFAALPPCFHGFGRTGRTVPFILKGHFRRTNPRFQPENFQRNLDLVAEVRRLADEKHFTAGQLALAWLLAEGEDVLPIPGTKRRAAQVVDSRAYS
jgi:aryl-alcohol dehydrogenase-like predicted oxidoreductase